MRKSILLLCLFLANLAVFSQEQLMKIRRQAYQDFVFKIPADSAEKYIITNRLNPDIYIGKMPDFTWHADTSRYDELPVGHYLIFSIQENELLVKYYVQSAIQAMAVNNQDRVLLDVRDSMGNLIANTSVWINAKAVPYSPVLQSFQLRQKRPDGAILKMVIPGDTLFMELTALDEVNTTWQQWWANFAYTKAGRVLSWPAGKIRTIGRYKYKSKRGKPQATNYGYMLFNKPIYKPGDTVKVKAYVLNRKQQQYTSPMSIWLQYVAKGQYKEIKMATLSAVSSGAFTYDFVLGDSLESDRSYQVLMKDKKDISRFKGSFKIEDYLLDEVASYSLNTDKEKVYRGDTLFFSANAKDANGLALMDGRVELLLLSENISWINEEKVGVADTLWRETKTLLVEGDTRFAIATKEFPNVDMTIRAEAVFRNSNNELQEETVTIDFNTDMERIEVKEENGFITAAYYENDTMIPAVGEMTTDFRERPVAVTFPFRMKVNPYVTTYTFSYSDSLRGIDVEEDFKIDGSYTLYFNYQQEEGEAGFSLYNPRQVLVQYTVFDGRKIVGKGSDTATYVKWKTVIPQGKMYRAEWNYIWAGEEENGYNTIALLDKILHTSIEGNTKVYPGKTDTITISIKDYKGKPASRVNLAVASYNSQFQKEIRVKEPPYLKKFRLKRRIVFDKYEMDDVLLVQRFGLGTYRDWVQKFSADTMLYYQLLFSTDSVLVKHTRITDPVPQLAVHVVEKGMPQEIYMLYVNKELAWYNGVTGKAPYAIATLPGYTQIGFRLKDKYIEIDSIYIQPWYKQDIVFNLEHLPAKAKVEKMDTVYTYRERELLEKSIWQLETGWNTANSYAWQGLRLTPISNDRMHILGPFSAKDSIHYYKPGAFDIKFPFEPGYQYKISPKMVRLEKKALFSEKGKVKLPSIKKPVWQLGDTLSNIPAIVYTKKPIELPFLYTTDTYQQQKKNQVVHTGRLKVWLPYDSAFSYIVLYGKGIDTLIVAAGNRFTPFAVNNLQPGEYELILVTNHHNFLYSKSLLIQADTTLCLRYNKPVYDQMNAVVQEIREEQARNEKRKGEAIKGLTTDLPVERTPPGQQKLLPVGTFSIGGTIIDKKGRAPITGCVIMVKGYTTGVVAGSDGTYAINGISEGKYILQFSSVGYETLEKTIEIGTGKPVVINAELEMATQSLDEVIVTGYSVTRKRNLTGAVTTVHTQELSLSLSGKLAGLTVENGSPGASVQIRGAGSIENAGQPVYIVDGIPVDKLPDDLELATMQVTVLKGAAATSLYGARAVNGVILINSPGFSNGGIRDSFRDYAFWQPNLITDKNGKAKFVVTYPDNITSWQTFVVGMDRKKRFTKAAVTVKSFKPMLAQLSAPRFLVEGDSSWIIGKAINYTASVATIKTSFVLNGQEILQQDKTLEASAASVEPLFVNPGKNDTLSLQYTMNDEKGYKDGELIKVPVLRKGIEEVTGQFWVLKGDTTVMFYPEQHTEAITLHAQSKTLDLLLDELNYLKRYPYYCLEQTASKLKGLGAEKVILKQLDRSFKEDKLLAQLLKKLQKEQLFDGGWSWWGGGESNLYITTYITRAITTLRQDPLVATVLRNAILYLQNQLPSIKGKQLPEILYTLSDAGHAMNYQSYLEKLQFDSLSIHEQWQFISIKQQQKMPYDKELCIVMEKKKASMLGTVHWGEDIYSWSHNAMATTTLAFRVLHKEKRYENLLDSILQYFLEQRSGGKWRNTVESASVVATLLPYLLQQDKSFIAKPLLIVNGETIEAFPFTREIKEYQDRIVVEKKGGGLLYTSTWQKKFNKTPLPVTTHFRIDSWFERQGRKVEQLISGEKVKMKIKVEVTTAAEYVQLEIPIPAGCMYAQKKQEGYRMHTEFLKDRVVLFIENMTKGVHEFEIELEPRYTGNYSINPAKAELMYFPVFYGRNRQESVVIQ